MFRIATPLDRLRPLLIAIFLFVFATTSQADRKKRDLRDLFSASTHVLTVVILDASPDEKFTKPTKYKIRSLETLKGTTRRRQNLIFGSPRTHKPSAQANKGESGLALLRMNKEGDLYLEEFIPMIDEKFLKSDFENKDIICGHPDEACSYKTFSEIKKYLTRE